MAIGRPCRSEGAPCARARLVAVMAEERPVGRSLGVEAPLAEPVTRGGGITVT
jgi:hypothetical protein